MARCIRLVIFSVLVFAGVFTALARADHSRSRRGWWEYTDCRGYCGMKDGVQYYNGMIPFVQYDTDSPVAGAERDLDRALQERKAWLIRAKAERVRASLPQEESRVSVLYESGARVVQYGYPEPALVTRTEESGRGRQIVLKPDQQPQTTNKRTSQQSVAEDEAQLTEIPATDGPKPYAEEPTEKKCDQYGMKLRNQSPATVRVYYKYPDYNNGEMYEIRRGEGLPAGESMKIQIPCEWEIGELEVYYTGILWKPGNDESNVVKGLMQAAPCEGSNLCVRPGKQP